MTVTFNHRYAALLDELEQHFPVADWRAGDLDLWPLARMDLYHDLYYDGAGIAAPVGRALPLRLAGCLVTPVRNLWRSRRDLTHHVVRAKPAHAVFLGDGFSLDQQDGTWRDRFGEPLIAALEARGRRTFLMQAGALQRLPWHRPTFPANVIESRGMLRSQFARRPLELPAHQDVLDFLHRYGLVAPSLSLESLARHARLVAATAAAFEGLLRRVEPTLVFTVTYHARVGPALMLACRRLGILSVAVQRTPHESAPQAYHWSSLPPRGYATLPAVFWNWNSRDTARLEAWAGSLAAPWHGAVCGGHTQLAPYLDDAQPVTREWDARLAAAGGGARFEREILVALQPLHGQRAVWDALSAQIEASPDDWRWWIRRHPASRPEQDREFGRLLALRARNVVTDAGRFPLPALLRHMSAMLSLGSGAAAEAAMFGVPSFFLIESARHTFGELLASGAARIIDVGSVPEAIAAVERRPSRPRLQRPPPLEETLRQLEARALSYRQACAAASGS